VNTTNVAPVSLDGAGTEAMLPSSSTQSHAYAQLKKQIRQHGLLDKQIGYYTRKMLILFAVLTIGWCVLLLFHPLWVVLVSALFLGVFSAQLGFIGHDAGHRQIFRSTRHNDLVGLIAGNLLLGMCISWWLDKHNQHHGRPNQTGADPDIGLPILAFTEEAARTRRGLTRFIVSHQALFFFPMLCLTSLSIQQSSIYFLCSKRSKYPILEPALMVAHYIGYIGILFFFLPTWEAGLFLALHQAIIGMYLGSTFAPNHKGMLIIGELDSVDFLHQQVLTARNVKPNPVIDYWYGGLNYQIEHHLFPTMPRNKLKYAQPIVKAFCAEHGISYYETGMLQSYQEILRHFHQISLSLRTRVAPA
jgi:fatty acid desaturase